MRRRYFCHVHGGEPRQSLKLPQVSSNQSTSLPHVRITRGKILPFTRSILGPLRCSELGISIGDDHGRVRHLF